MSEGRAGGGRGGGRRGCLQPPYLAPGSTIPLSPIAPSHLPLGREVGEGSPPQPTSLASSPSSSLPFSHSPSHQHRRDGLKAQVLSPATVAHTYTDWHRAAERGST